jgi:hypothetical protein
MVPMQLCRFRLNRPSQQDVAWLHRTLARESAKLGTPIAMQQNGDFVVDNDA